MRISNWLSRAYAQLSPEPYQPFVDKLDMKKFYALDIPKSYLNCTEDIAPAARRMGLASTHVFAARFVPPGANAG